MGGGLLDQPPEYLLRMEHILLARAQAEQMEEKRRESRRKLNKMDKDSRG